MDLRPCDFCHQDRYVEIVFVQDEKKHLCSGCIDCLDSGEYWCAECFQWRESSDVEESPFVRGEMICLECDCVVIGQDV